MLSPHQKKITCIPRFGMSIPQPTPSKWTVYTSFGSSLALFIYILISVWTCSFIVFLFSVFHRHIWPCVCNQKKTNKTKRKKQKGKKEGIYRRGSFWCDKEHNTEDNLARETRPSRERVPAFFIHRLDKPESFSLLSFEIIRLYKIKLLKTSDSNHFAAFFSISSLSSGWGKGMFIRRNGGVPVWQEPKKKKRIWYYQIHALHTHTHTETRETQTYGSWRCLTGVICWLASYTFIGWHHPPWTKKKNKTKIFQKTLEA